VDLDLLLTGAILHDVGKIYELVYDRTFGYSDNGQLLGHIHLGLRIVDDKLRSLPSFPARLRSLVEHMILSHHGELEFGSPKVPLFAEALLLHHLDNLDSKLESMRRSVESDRIEDSLWTPINYALDRPVLKKERYLNPPAEPKLRRAPAPEAEKKHPARKLSSFGEQLQDALGEG